MPNQFGLAFDGQYLKISGLVEFAREYQKVVEPSYLEPRQIEGVKKCKFCKKYHRIPQNSVCSYCERSHHSDACWQLMDPEERENGNEKCAKRYVERHGSVCQFFPETVTCARAAALDLEFCKPCKVRHDSSGWRICLRSQRRRYMSVKARVVWNLRARVFFKREFGEKRYSRLIKGPNN